MGPQMISYGPFAFLVTNLEAKALMLQPTHEANSGELPGEVAKPLAAPNRRPLRTR